MKEEHVSYQSLQFQETEMWSRRKP